MSLPLWIFKSPVKALSAYRSKQQEASSVHSSPAHAVQSFQSLQSLPIAGLALLLSVGGFVGTSRPAQAQRPEFCHLPTHEVQQKQQLLVAGLRGDERSMEQYEDMVDRHAEFLKDCRQQNWPQNQAIWVRLYPCDARPGVMEQLFDMMVNKGYNRVYVEVFGAGQVLLPQADNPTVWPSVVRSPGYENQDLLAEAIAKGRERGMKVYAWMFSMNFGHSYLQRSGSPQILARNGQGQSSLDYSRQLSINGGEVNHEEVFIDPYNAQARTDYYTLVQSVLRRNPDGMLFDYIRYPRGSGADSVADRVDDLWIYGSSAQQAFLQRAQNRSGQDIIRRFLQRGYLTNQDVVEVASLHPGEPQPLWQSLEPTSSYGAATADQRRVYLQQNLWRLAIAHAFQGVVDFLNTAAAPVQSHGIPAGAVFFPEGNQFVGQTGIDSRVQPWDRFPRSMEWHPMSYATCGGTGCIVSQIQRVVEQATNPGQVKPVLAGDWGERMNNRPALEAQMLAIRQAAPQIRTVSHFAFSWQEPEYDRQRKFCEL